MTLTAEQLPPLALLLGWLLDLALGDPARLPHPVVWFGRWIAFWERKLNRGSRRKAKGAILAVASIALTFSLATALLRPAYPCHIGTAVQALLIFYCLAGTTLRREVTMVFEAVDRSLEDGRRQVARIVGRDTGSLSANEIRTAALETLAENLSDGVIAPLFWLCLLGVPGMLAYKMVNTLDSMIGYRSARYKDFGCWAAHIDDLANYLPARLTALAMVLVGWVYARLTPHSDQLTPRSAHLTPHPDHLTPRSAHLMPRPTLTALIRFVTTYGSRHASPNSGWPEAALAGILGCRFGGAHDYFGERVDKPYIGDTPRALTAADLHTALAISFATECLFVALALYTTQPSPFL